MARKNALLESRDACGGDIGKPDRAIRGHRQSAQPNDGCRQRERVDAAVRRDTRDRPHRGIGVPGAALSIRSEPERFEVLRPLEEPVDLAVSKYADCIGELDGEPDRSIWPFGDASREASYLKLADHRACRDPPDFVCGALRKPKGAVGSSPC